MEKNLRQVSLQNGVVLGFDDNQFCLDIDIEPGIDHVIFGNDWAVESVINLKGQDKVFPDVTTIIVEEEIADIYINNKMFPNVRHVESRNQTFANGDMLVKLYDNNEDDNQCLYNTFCRKPDEKIDVSAIRIVMSEAFSDCESVNIVNTQYIFKCEGGAFKNSAIERLPFVNGVKSIGNIVVDFDYKCDNVILPDDREEITAIEYSLSLAKLKKLTLHKCSTLMTVFEDILPERICFSGKNYIDIDGINLMKSLNNVRYIDIEGSDTYKSIDGIIYSIDGKTLYACPSDRNGTIIIPEGVEMIEEEAFCACAISEIMFPSTLREIKSRAFSGCYELRKVNFGIGITEIGSHQNVGVFKYCSRLTSIEIPSQVAQIGVSAFEGTGIEKLVLHEGLKTIEDYAFYHCKIDNLSLPKSLDSVGVLAFTDANEIHAEKYLATILCAIINTSMYYCSDMHKVTKLMIDGKTAYIPKIVPDEGVICDIDDILCAFFNEDVVSESTMENVYRLFEKGSMMEGRENMAIGICLDDKDNWVAREYVGRHSSMIASRLIKEGKAEKIEKFLSIGAMNRQAAEMILEYAEDKKQVTLVAGVLDIMHKGHDGQNAINQIFSI